MEELKELYHLRWDEEISFRELKHIIGAVDFHSTIVEYVTHELWARLLLYNFCSRITSLVVVRQNETEHEYQVNFTMAYHSKFPRNILHPLSTSIVFEHPRSFYKFIGTQQYIYHHWWKF